LTLPVRANQNVTVDALAISVDAVLTSLHMLHVCYRPTRVFLAYENGADEQPTMHWVLRWLFEDVINYL